MRKAGTGQGERLDRADSALEYENVTRDHPWERGNGSREILNCRNCLQDLEIMRLPGKPGQEALAVRIMPAAATRIGNGMDPSPCPGTPAPEGASYFLRSEGGRMTRVQPEVFYQAIRRDGMLGQ